MKVECLGQRQWVIHRHYCSTSCAQSLCTSVVIGVGVLRHGGTYLSARQQMSGNGIDVSSLFYLWRAISADQMQVCGASCQMGKCSTTCSIRVCTICNGSRLLLHHAQVCAACARVPYRWLTATDSRRDKHNRWHSINHSWWIGNI